MKLCLRKWFGMHYNQSQTALFGLGQPIRIFLYHFQQTFNAIAWRGYLAIIGELNCSKSLLIFFYLSPTEAAVRYLFNGTHLFNLSIRRIFQKWQETRNRTIHKGRRHSRSTKNTIKIGSGFTRMTKKAGPLSVGLHLEQNSSSFEY